MMLRPCTLSDIPAIDAIINEAAEAYRGVIPAECWHEPYMKRESLLAELAAGVSSWGWEESGELAGVAGLQQVRDASLIRHAYVKPALQGRGIGGKLLAALIPKAQDQLLVGTWEAAGWAIAFYEKHGFRLTARAETDRLLTTYWRIPDRQRIHSVVLAYAPGEVDAA